MCTPWPLNANPLIQVGFGNIYRRLKAVTRKKMGKKSFLLVKATTYASTLRSVLKEGYYKRLFRWLNRSPYPHPPNSCLKQA